MAGRVDEKSLARRIVGGRGYGDRSIQQRGHLAHSGPSGRGYSVVRFEPGSPARGKRGNHFNRVVSFTQADIDRAVFYSFRHLAERIPIPFQNVGKGRFLFWLHLFQPGNSEFHVEAARSISAVYRTAWPIEHTGERSACRTLHHGYHSVEQYYNGTMHSIGATESDAGRGGDSGRDWSQYWDHRDGARSQHQDAENSSPCSAGKPLLQYLWCAAFPAVSEVVRVGSDRIGL